MMEHLKTTQGWACGQDPPWYASALSPACWYRQCSVGACLDSPAAAAPYHEALAELAHRTGSGSLRSPSWWRLVEQTWGGPRPDLLAQSQSSLAQVPR